MKGFIIFEDFKKIINCKEILDGDYNCVISDCPNGTFNGIINRVTGATCSKEDTYDFETGALIALMKMCGVEKVKKAAKETFFDVAENSVNEYEEEINTLKEKFVKKVSDLRDQIHENSRLIQTNGELKDKVKELEEENKKLKKEKEQIIVEKSILNNKLLEENSRLEYIKSCNESIIESLENTRDLLINKNNELIEENKKLKLDCEKLQHGYVDTDKANPCPADWDGDVLNIVFLPGRACGKQHKALVELFKKIPQDNIDAAYREAYNTTLPVWQKEVFKQMCDIHKESKEKIELPRTLDINGTVYRKSIQIKDFGEQINKLTVDSLIEQNRAFTRKCVDEWLYKILTRREKMWERIFELHKENDIVIEVKKEDVNTFLHELENKIPEITWVSGVKIFETEYTIDDIYARLKLRDVVYFRLRKENTLSYSGDPDIYQFKELKRIDYLPPIRWDLFKKGRIVVGCTEEEVPEFREKVVRELGNVRMEKYSVENLHCNGPIKVYFHYDKDTNWLKPLLVSGIPRVKINNHKVVYWEDVR